MCYRHKMKLVLCHGRHNVPQAVDGYIFENAVDPLDVAGLEERALYVLQDCETLDLYVTGLTVALVATLNAARRLGVHVTLWHYDRDANDYYPQKVEN